MTKFRSPVRRATRQESGHHVCEETTGSECKIVRSKRLNLSDSRIRIRFQNPQIKICLLFQQSLAIVAFGGYLKTEKRIKCTLDLHGDVDGLQKRKTTEFEIQEDCWSKIGIMLELSNLSQKTEIKNVVCELNFVSETGKIGLVNFFGFNLDGICYDYFVNGDDEVGSKFHEKTSIYLPEIFYFSHDEPFSIQLDVPLEKFEDGEVVVLKSCNRCGRFLLIDADDERNTISFSNHCTSRAPCTHNAFSRYITSRSDVSILPDPLKGRVEESSGKYYFRQHFGFQLECKSCKKFFVNAPLNPMRNSTQHREDSLRRRNIEILVDTLLKKEWIYHKFRRERKKEFDHHIWEKFGKKCFKCGKILDTPNKMDLDHTMPLAAFYPLDESATCLCEKCNSLKHDRYPIEFYSQGELEQLSQITGLKIEFLKSKSVNKVVIDRLKEEIVWFFDTFLADMDLQKVRDGKLTADLVYNAIIKQIRTIEPTCDLIKIYQQKTGKNPRSITN